MHDKQKEREIEMLHTMLTPRKEAAYSHKADTKRPRANYEQRKPRERERERERERVCERRARCRETKKTVDQANPYWPAGV
jgi:hypothetical protein